MPSHDTDQRRPAQDDKFASLIEPVARQLWKEPNEALSNGHELRWGSKGSRSIDLRKGTWYNHELQQGGVVLDLIQRELHCGKRDAVAWLKNLGFIVDREPKGVVKTYDYHDANGNLIYQTVRTSDRIRRFYQRRRHGRDGFINNLDGVEPTLYRLVELLADMAQPREEQKLWFICEGEKDVETLVAWDFQATTNSGGAGNFKPELAHHFRDAADVIILEDNDEAGAARSARLAPLLFGVGARVRVLRIADYWPACPVHGDITDWRDHAGGSADRLFDILDKLGDWQPPPATDKPSNDNDGAFDPGPPPEGEPVKRAPRITLIPFESLKPASEPEYLVQDFIPSGGLVIVWGPPKCGKSFWTMDVMLHVALGWEYRGHPVRQGAIVYCAFEGAAGYGKRKEAFRLRNLESHTDPVPFYLMPTPMDFVREHGELVEVIRRTLGDTKPGAVVLDTLNRSLAGSESKDEDMAAYIKAADAIRATFGCAVVIVHHCGHDTNRPRGHTSLAGAGDAQIAICRDPASNVIAEVEWLKDGEEGAKVACRLERVDVGTDPNGQPISSCVVVPADNVPIDKPAKPARPAKMPRAATIALRALREAIDEMGEVPPASSHIPSGVRVVAIDQWQKYAIRLGVSTSDEDASRKQAFRRGSEALIADRLVAVWTGQAWPTT
jgi:hypothetical protein